jgi:hypothetical protein
MVRVLINYETNFIVPFDEANKAFGITFPPSASSLLPSGTDTDERSLDVSLVVLATQVDTRTDSPQDNIGMGLFLWCVC